jgi:hypothetical protein
MWRPLERILQGAACIIVLIVLFTLDRFVLPLLITIQPLLLVLHMPLMTVPEVHVLHTLQTWEGRMIDRVRILRSARGHWFAICIVFILLAGVVRADNALVCDVDYSPSCVTAPGLLLSPPGGNYPSTRTITVTLTNVGDETADFEMMATEEWVTPGSVFGQIDAGATLDFEFVIGPFADYGDFGTTLFVKLCGVWTSGIPIDVYVVDFYDIFDWVELSTVCWSIGVKGDARVGLGDWGENYNMHWPSIDETFLYDAGLIVTYAEDTAKTSFSFNGGSFSGVRFLTQNFEYSTHEGYEWAHGTFRTQDCYFWGDVEYYLPTDPETCVLIERYSLCNHSDRPRTVHIGIAIDWDIPDGGDGTSNVGGYEEGTQIIYQRSPLGLEYYGGATLCSDLVGGAILQNDEWVYPNSGFVPAEIGGLLARQTGVDLLFDPENPEDLTSVHVVAQDVVLEPDLCYKFCLIKASSITGLTGLRTQLCRGMMWIDTYGLDCECTRSCESDCVPGDANCSGAVDIDDVVWIIDFIFGGGVPCDAGCCMDANGSGGDIPVDIDDAVYLISYIFLHSSPPQPSCWD